MARLDTGWHAHPKILRLGLAAMGLHAWSISYCDDALSDGFIPMGAWPSLGGATAAVKSVVAAGLWEPVDGGYHLHDYADYNRTKAQVDAQREEDRVRKVSGRTNGRNPAGHFPESEPESGRIPRAPGPGPGPVFNSRPPAWQAGRTRARARTRGGDDLQPLATFLPADLPDEVLQRLGQAPLGQPAEPASPAHAAQETNGDARC